MVDKCQSMCEESTCEEKKGRERKGEKEHIFKTCSIHSFLLCLLSFALCSGAESSMAITMPNPLLPLVVVGLCSVNLVDFYKWFRQVVSFQETPKLTANKLVSQHFYIKANVEHKTRISLSRALLTDWLFSI